MYVAVFLLLICSLSRSQELYDGPIRFKGRIVGEKFLAQRFEIRVADENFVVTSVGLRNQFRFNSGGMVISDVVVSLDESCVAVSLRSMNWKKPDMALVTLGKDGVVKRFDYKLQHLNEDFGWIVELAAISNDGERLLAKCARMVNNGAEIKLAGHEWAVLTFENNKLYIGASDGLASQWEKMLEKKAKPTKNSMNPRAAQ